MVKIKLKSFLFEVYILNLFFLSFLVLIPIFFAFLVLIML